jgi:hypothetical protein
MRLVAALIAALISAAPAVAQVTGDDGTAPLVVPIGADGGAAPFAPLPPPPPASPEAQRGKGRWYGWELMLSDALFLLLAVDGGGGRPELPTGSAGLPLGLVGGVTTPSALHFIHGNKRRAGFGLLVRGGVVGFVALAGGALNNTTSSSCANMDHCSGIDIDGGDLVLAGLMLVAAGGGITYAVSEYFGVSRVAVGAPPRPRATVMPTAYLRPSGGGLGLVGSF